MRPAGPRGGDASLQHVLAREVHALVLDQRLADHDRPLGDVASRHSEALSFGVKRDRPPAEERVQEREAWPVPARQNSVHFSEDQSDTAAASRPGTAVAPTTC